MKYQPFLVVGLSIALLAGCGGERQAKDGGAKKSANEAAQSKATEENFKKIKVGMTKAQVDAILGPSDSTTELIDGSMKLWSNIGINDAGKVTSTSMKK